jgi:hypothetical protein
MDDHVITIHSRIDRWTGRVLCTRPVRPRRMTMTMDLFPQAKMQWAMQGAGRVHSAVVVWGSMFCFRCFFKGARGVRDSLAPSVVAVARRCVCCCFWFVGVPAAFGSKGIEASTPLSCRCNLGCMDHESHSFGSSLLFLGPFLTRLPPCDYASSV